MIINESLSDSQHKQYSNRVNLSYHNNEVYSDLLDLITKNDLTSNPVTLYYKISRSGILPRGYSCSAYVGFLARLFDHYNLPYRIYNGQSVPGEEVNRDVVNHTWLESNGKIYETGDFVGTPHFKYKEVYVK